MVRLPDRFTMELPVSLFRSNVPPLITRSFETASVGLVVAASRKEAVPVLLKVRLPATDVRFPAAVMLFDWFGEFQVKLPNVWPKPPCVPEAVVYTLASQ